MYSVKNEKAKLQGDPELNGMLVEYPTADGLVFEPVTNLLNWIEKNGLNLESVYSGNSSPYGDGNPEYDETEEVEMLTADQYLDEHFEEVATVYFKEVLAA